jgi:hypothetical protein
MSSMSGLRDIAAGGTSQCRLFGVIVGLGLVRGHRLC